MSRYFTFEDQLKLRTQAYMLIGIAWLMGAISLWAYANMEFQVQRFSVVFAAFLIIAKLIGFCGWRDYAKSKGYHSAYGLFSFIPVLGEMFLVFMHDRWLDQPVPRIKAQKQAW
ncbi:MAG TPA: hypothetical protein VGL56_15965 [Fimbriimonadaceae bacterium]